MKVLYNIVYSVLILLYLPVFVFTTRKKGYTVDLKERIVLYSDKKRKKFLWFHCASVGELNVAYPLINRLKEKYNILITVISPRGKSYAKEKYPFATVRTVPFDFSFLINRFLKIYNPEALILVEGEFWYNLVTETGKKIPVISVNARISPSSYKKYKKLSLFYKKIFSAISLFLVRSQKDFEYLKNFVSKDKLILCGDLKFISSQDRKGVFLDKKGKKLIVAGSTHDPEEKVILTIFKDLKLKYPDLKLLIAPRHLERVKEVIQLVKEEGFSYSLRSKTEKLEKDVYILDTIGELSGIYRYADLVFVGGTIAPVGGHNILEPALEGKPVVIGKHYEKIQDLYLLLKEFNIVYTVNDGKEMEKIFEEFLQKEKSIDIDFSQIQEKILSCYLTNIERVLSWKK
ncbi:3-deoxy-D-manno-octulosonic acid transferase [Persephonella sp.]